MSSWPARCGRRQAPGGSFLLADAVMLAAKVKVWDDELWPERLSVWVDISRCVSLD